MNAIITRLTATTIALNEAQKTFGNPMYSDVVQIEIAKSLAVIADELHAIRTSMPRK